MTIRRKLTAGIVATALLSGSITPAFAHDYDRGWGRGHHRWHDHDHVDAGDVIAGVAVIGILAAILSSSGKKKHDTARRDGDINSEDAAVDACAQATEAQAGAKASVRDITQVDRNAEGWDVEGIVEQRTEWRDDSDTERRRFTCSVRYGAVQNVTIDTDTVAFN
jgi:hypothetical protein